jgi:hypothetical protein
MQRPFFQPPGIAWLCAAHRDLITLGARAGLYILSTGLPLLLLLLGSSAAQFSTDVFAGTLPKSKGSQKKPSRPEILQLIRDLAAPDKHKRAKAYQQLVDIGPPVVTGGDLRQEWLGDDDKAFKALGPVIAAIQAKHGIQLVRASGMEFLVIMDPIWRIPANNMTFGLLGQDLQALEGNGALGAFPDWLREKRSPLRNGESTTVTPAGTKLCRSADGKELWLEVQDGCNTYAFRGLKPGRYFFFILLGHRVKSKPKLQFIDGVQLWQGFTTTPYIAIEIK